MIYRRQPSIIERLGLCERVEQLLEEHVPYDQMSEIVKRETGHDVSRSAMARYHRRWAMRRLEEKTIAREVQALVAMVAHQPDSNIRQGAKSLVLHKLVQAMAKSDDSFQDASDLDLANLLIKMDRLEQQSGELAVQRERLDVIRARAQAAAETAKGALVRAGVPPEQITHLIDQILGVVP